MFLKSNTEQLGNETMALNWVDSVKGYFLAPVFNISKGLLVLSFTSLLDPWVWRESSWELRV
jgi:hypothetical protein